jgi:thymidine kinase
MASNSTDHSATIDSHIANHNEMEHIANRAGDFTKADHHRKMQEIYKAMKEKQQLYEIRDQLSDEVQFEKGS